ATPGRRRAGRRRRARLREAPVPWRWPGRRELAERSWGSAFLGRPVPHSSSIHRMNGVNPPQVLTQHCPVLSTNSGHDRCTENVDTSDVHSGLTGRQASHRRGRWDSHWTHECRLGHCERREVAMAKLIYSMLTSLDGYIEDEKGAFGWGAPADEAVHTFVNELAAPMGTFLYGRRMYET